VCVLFVVGYRSPQAGLPTEEETKQMIIDACHTLGIEFNFETKTIS